MAHARCIILIDDCEESGSYHLPYYVDHLAAWHRRGHLVMALLTFPAAAPLRDPRSGAIMGNSPFYE